MIKTYEILINISSVSIAEMKRVVSSGFGIMARHSSWRTAKYLLLHPRLTAGAGSMFSKQIPIGIGSSSKLELSSLFTGSSRSLATQTIKDKLPHLPVPALNDTLIKYLR